MFLSFSTLRSPAHVLKCCRRSLFSFPGFSSSLSKAYREQCVLPYDTSLPALLALTLVFKRYSAKELYAVVADVSSYPKFVPFCIASRTDASALARAMQQKTVFEAELSVGFMSFKESYVSSVICVPYESVHVRSYHLFQLFGDNWHSFRHVLHLLHRYSRNFPRPGSFRVGHPVQG